MWSRESDSVKLARETNLQDLQDGGQRYIVCRVPEVQPNTLLSSPAIGSTNSEGFSHSSRKRPYNGLVSRELLIIN